MGAHSKSCGGQIQGFTGQKTASPVRASHIWGWPLRSVPGDHTLHVEAPGYKPVRRDVTLKATTPADIKSQTITIRLEKR